MAAASASLALERLPLRLASLAGFLSTEHAILHPRLLTPSESWKEASFRDNRVELESIPAPTLFLHLIDCPKVFSDGESWRSMFRLLSGRLVLWRMRLASCRIHDQVVLSIAQHFRLLVWLNLRSCRC